MKKYLLTFFILLCQILNSKDTKPTDGILLNGIVIDGDTFPIIYLETVVIEDKMKFKTKKQYEKWTKLKYNVRVTYPYAIIAAARLKEYENVLNTIKDEEQKKEYMKVVEKNLKKEFEKDLKKLTMSQGKILIKLIDRETGRTSYDLVKQLRGNFSAWMWQGLAKLFGSDLKSEYDEKGEDKLIEIAIIQIESGG